MITFNDCHTAGGISGRLPLAGDVPALGVEGQPVLDVNGPAENRPPDHRTRRSHRFDLELTPGGVAGAVLSILDLGVGPEIRLLDNSGDRRFMRIRK